MSDSEFVKKRSRRQPALASSTTADSAAAETVSSGDAAFEAVTLREGLANIKNSPSYRLMLGVVIVLGVLIVIAIALVIVGIFTRVSGHGAPSAPAVAAATRYMLPPGSKILTMQITNNRLVLGVRTGSDSEVDIFDTQTGQLIGQIKPKGQ
ncbi:MAG TPA: DUF6476 family protein [Rhizomicrobium sp.]|jgi:flagellar biogenesis protein FliO|nr:DUF6476 family protein [Rhizomicrobium sp.]